jgi:hypothetical protein
MQIRGPVQIHEVNLKDDRAWVRFMVEQSVHDAYVRQWEREEAERRAALTAEQLGRAEPQARVAAACFLLMFVGFLLRLVVG